MTSPDSDACTDPLRFMNFDYGRIDVAMQRMLSVMAPVKVILFGFATREDVSDDGDIDLPIASGRMT